MSYDSSDEDYLDDPSYVDRSVSSKDALNYRASIQMIVNRCFFSIGTFAMKHHVTALKTALYFQIPGLPFKTRIDDKLAELETEKQQRIAEIKEHLGREFYSNANIALTKIKINRWYWQVLFEYLLNLLAEHDALMKAKAYVEGGESL